MHRSRIVFPHQHLHHHHHANPANYRISSGYLCSPTYSLTPVGKGKYESPNFREVFSSFYSMEWGWCFREISTSIRDRGRFWVKLIELNQSGKGGKALTLVVYVFCAHGSWSRGSKIQENWFTGSVILKPFLWRWGGVTHKYLYLSTQRAKRTKSRKGDGSFA